MFYYSALWKQRLFQCQNHTKDKKKNQMEKRSSMIQDTMNKSKKMKIGKRWILDT